MEHGLKMLEHSVGVFVFVVAMVVWMLFMGKIGTMQEEMQWVMEHGHDYYSQEGAS